MVLSSSPSPESAMPPQSILSPSESHNFQSFLSAIADPSNDWNVDIDVPKDRQALAKATKDLMSLDASHWPTYDHQPPTSHPHHFPQRQASVAALPPAHLSLFLPPHQQYPHNPASHSSSRTPTPTSASTFPFPPIDDSSSSSSAAGKHPRPPRQHHSHPYPIAQPPSRQRRAQPQQPKQRPKSQSLSIPLPQPHASTSAASLQPQIPQKPVLLSASQKKANHIQSEQKRRANIRRGYEALCECVPALRDAIREEDAAAAAAIAAAAHDRRSASLGPQKQRKGKARAADDKEREKIDGRAGPRSENVVLSKTIEYINDLLDDRSALLARLHRARSTLPPGHPALVVPPRRRQRNINQHTNGTNHHPHQHSYPNGHLSQQPDHDERNDDDDGDDDGGPLWEREWKGGHGRLGDIIQEEDGEDSS